MTMAEVLSLVHRTPTVAPKGHFVEPLGVIMGADPEFFLLDKEGKSVPAHKFFPSKTELVAAREKEMEDGIIAYNSHLQNGIIRDGYAVELNPNASPCRALLGSSLSYLYKAVLDKVARTRGASTINLIARSTVEVDLEALKKDAPKDVLTAGCHPSRNAYNAAASTVPVPYNQYPLRHAGGHIHISGNNNQTASGAFVKRLLDVDPENLSAADSILINSYVKLLDLFVGGAYHFLYGDRLDVKSRSALYGQPGEYRFQEYGGGKKGLEYRSLGPEPFIHPALFSFFFGIARWVTLNLSALFFEFEAPGTELTFPQAANWGPIVEKVERGKVTVPYYYDLSILEKLKALLPEFGEAVNPDMFTSYQAAGEAGWREFAQMAGWALPTRR